ncbi:hypothetical protein GDO86_004568 [Hymenochirus boettgeri]|uniref:Histone-lysine N-methyltransferase SETDB2 n=1 Tax=Hymenochirus boettgeri TaxID=247094 RepID=A0A8T2KEL9_9PIPI|nr:hypothetical protein GDO86_004568 [Hymenochirus boettgeri]
MERSTDAAHSTVIPRTKTLITKDISLKDAQEFWKDCQASETVDQIFEQVMNRLKQLWQKIKDGSATNLEYLKAMILVNYENVEEDTDGINFDIHTEHKQSENKDCSKTRREEACLGFNSDCESEDARSESENISTSVSSTVEKFFYRKHTCNKSCLLNVNPYPSKSENPLKRPVLCDFQRFCAKRSCVEKQPYIVYKAPCGRSLRDYDEVHTYLTETGCHFLCVDNFSFNTLVRLNSCVSFIQSIVLDSDISRDIESVPVSFCNEIDDTKPPPFTYRKTSWPPGYSINNFRDIFEKCCNCSDGCLDISTCSCLQETAKHFLKYGSRRRSKFTPGYEHKRLQEPIATGLYECNVSCKCDRMLCQNRVVQHGLQVRLQVFRTSSTGWGVRCLDDLDKGTFVCTYAGRILRKSTVKDKPEGSLASSKNDNGDKETTSVLVNNRKRKSSHSDSEVAVLHSNPYSMRSLTNSPLKPIHCHPTNVGYRGRDLSLMPIRRPKTKTSMLQKRTRQLIEEGAHSLQHSSDDERPTPPSSPKQKLKLHAEILSNTCVNELASGYVSEDSCSSVISSAHPMESSLTKGQEDLNPLSSCLPFAVDRKFEKNIHILDASKEGNVARFLNHSCSPNLFVQPVFVDTHHKCFPWVAFFTKRLVTAGTELTWDYNYEIGTFTEKEIQCVCGEKACKRKIV